MKNIWISSKIRLRPGYTDYAKPIITPLVLTPLSHFFHSFSLIEFFDILWCLMLYSQSTMTAPIKYSLLLCILRNWGISGSLGRINVSPFLASCVISGFNWKFVKTIIIFPHIFPVAYQRVNQISYLSSKWSFSKPKHFFIIIFLNFKKMKIAFHKSELYFVPSVIISI